jgi:hypothetical protein
MIPSDPNEIEKLKELADRNIANGDWGDEITAPGLSGDTVPQLPEDQKVKRTISHILSRRGGLRLPKNE